MNAKRLIGVTCLMAAGLFLAGGCGTAFYQASAMGLKGYWPMDEGSGETVKNAGGSNHGQIKDGLKWTDGKHGKAIAFDGSGYVFIDSAPYLNAGQYTFAAWAKLKDTSEYQYIVWRGGPEFPEPTKCRTLDIWITMSGTLSGILHYKDPDALPFMLEGTAKVTDGKWHHVVCVNDGKTVTFYVDGKKDASGELAGPLATSQFPLWIGARPSNVAATGIIDEVKFFDQALTAEQVAALE